MIELYHNAFSSCSQKVRIVLGEKGIEWKGHDIDLQGGGQHDPEYVKLNPNSSRGSSGTRRSRWMATRSATTPGSPPPRPSSVIAPEASPLRRQPS